MRPFNGSVWAWVGIASGILAAGACGMETEADQVVASFVQPPQDCKPHTRWWWMGNALSKEDISWQLDQMQAQGIGGVEQITMEPVYIRGNHEYLSQKYFDLLRHAAEQASQRKMSLSINFGGPGWIWGGEWVPKEDQSKVMLTSTVLLDGPQSFTGTLSDQATLNPRDIPRSMPHISSEDRLLKVVAGRLEQGRLQERSLIDLSAQVQGRLLTWAAPEGQWQVMAFWLTQRDNANAVDPLNREAMSRYCETLGGKYAAAISDYFGTAVKSFFGDSFEVPIYRNGLYWTDGLFETFAQTKGYDLVPLLPALWWEVDDLSSKVRYDVNSFLHEQGMDAFFQVFLDWCKRHGVQGRIQPYGFVTDIIEGAGKTPIPEMEITPGEKDAVPWLDARIGPRAYVASGAHLYNKNIVSTEAFTYLHWEPYRATLEELKIATDGFLCAGANKLYNHGYLASPERDIVPTRGFFAAIRISHENIWWRYYHHLAAYTARCCLLLRQGRFIADAAVYSPLANQWTQSVLNARKWTREFDFGGLGQLLTANGYAFDLVNDDVMQHHAVMMEEQIHLGAMAYRVLILPDIAAIPMETMKQMEAYVRNGGNLIALERIPEAATGMRNYKEEDAAVQRIAVELFQEPTGRNEMGHKQIGRGQTFFLKTVLRREDPLDWRSASLDPFLKALRCCATPDMHVNRTFAGRRNNEGLMHIHRRTETMDIYFTANVQYMPVHAPVGFRTTKGQPHVWDACTGTRRPILSYTRDEEYTWVPLELAPFESRCIIFENLSLDIPDAPHMVQSDFADILHAGREEFIALANRNGLHAYSYFNGFSTCSGMAQVEDIPAAYAINGAWNVCFEEKEGEVETRLPTLKSWTEDERWKHFSGCVRYAMEFFMSGEYFSEGMHLSLSLGRVGNVAEIWLNEKPVGVHWMSGQVFDLDGLIQPGANTLRVKVTNTLINRVSGLEAFPDVPEELKPLYGSGIHRSTREADALLGFEPLPDSGLMGPVLIIPHKEIHVDAAKSCG